jgi:glycosyltransferase involved in cell wall biosynthesis
MSTAPEFSVVIPTHNRPELLAEALRSVREQTIADFECIVVDDGSRTARDVLPSDPRFILVELPASQGAGAARNAGLDAARGLAVAFLDDDDEWTPIRLELARAGLARADIAICASRWMDQAAPHATRHLEGDVHDRILDKFTPPLGQTAVRLDRVPRFDPSYLGCQDIEWWLRATHGTTVATVDEIGLLSRRHMGVRSTNARNVRIGASIRLMEEHADYFRSHRRARAFRQYRIGTMLHGEGDSRQARRWLLQSLWTLPSGRALRAVLSPIR